MGFLDRAKQMAEQAQTKLDDVQKQFNESQQAKGGTPGPEQPATEYDKHGRPVGQAAPGPVSEADSPPPPESPAPPAQPGAGEEAGLPAEPPKPPSPPSEGLGESPTEQADGEYAPPKLSGGDPLAG